jgi:hypothetical protein
VASLWCSLLCCAVQEERLAELLAAAKANANAVLKKSSDLKVQGSSEDGDGTTVRDGASVVTGKTGGKSVGRSRAGSIAGSEAGGGRRFSSASGARRPSNASVTRRPSNASPTRRPSIGAGSAISRRSRSNSIKGRSRRGSRSGGGGGGSPRSSVSGSVMDSDEDEDAPDSSDDDDSSMSVMSVRERESLHTAKHNKALARAQKRVGATGPFIPLSELELEPSKVLPPPTPPPPTPPPPSDSDTTVTSDYTSSSTPEPSSGDEEIVARVEARKEALRKNPEHSVAHDDALVALMNLPLRDARALKRHAEIAAFRANKLQRRRLHEVRGRARWKKRQRQAEVRLERQGKKKAAGAHDGVVGEKRFELPESTQASTMLYRFRGAALAVDVIRKQPQGKQSNVFCRMDKGVWQQGTAKNTMRVRGQHLQSWMKEQERMQTLHGKEDDKLHVIRAIHRAIKRVNLPRLKALADRAVAFKYGVHCIVAWSHFVARSSHPVLIAVSST